MKGTKSVKSGVSLEGTNAAWMPNHCLVHIVYWICN